MTEQISDAEYEELSLKIKIPRVIDLPSEERMYIHCIQKVLEEFAEYVFSKEFTDVEYKPVIVIVSPYHVILGELLHKYYTGELQVCKGSYCIKVVEGTYIILLRDVKHIKTYFHELYHHYQELKGEEYESKLLYDDRKSEQDAQFMARKLNWKYGKLLQEKLKQCKRDNNIIERLREEMEELKKKKRRNNEYKY